MLDPTEKDLLDAADAINTLQARIAELVKERERQEGFANAFESLSDNLKNEIARLQAENTALVKESKTDPYMTEHARLQAENERLIRALRLIAPLKFSACFEAPGIASSALAIRAALKENHGKP